MIHTLPVPAALQRRLAIALIAGVLSLVLTTAQGMVRDGYDAWQQAVSALSLGPGGWLQMLNLVALGVAILSTVVPWRRILAGGRGGTSYPILTALVGAGFVAVGLIAQDPAPGYDPAGLALHAPTAHGIAHLAIAGVAALASVTGFFVIAARFAGDPAWRGWPAWSIAAAIGVVTCITVYGIESTQSHGLAGTFERAAMIIPMLWTWAFLRRLRAGAPLMLPAAISQVEVA